ncbi:efflux transporter outer membrane subunit [Cupriavidus sp. AU9028]|uniref:efflux transporter outer membrane subunit n=1 Tax=Cupriavidus sp. AU9028 TaxID=2871157 RepID=UPI001C950C03|nr:efflux transporter outer membrane subunit [Cupriavidus sp. AU9028]MBY4895934.1 efflux transporter outer membrane subunit [Cupriavidus sp. AU9028]
MTQLSLRRLSLAALALVPVVALLMSGCAGPRPAAPEAAAVTPPPAWREQAGPAAPIERDWWRRYGDPVLTQLVETALRNNPDLGIAAARLAEANAQQRLARAQMLPTLDAVASGGRSRSLSALGRESLSNTFEPQLEAALPLDLYGRLSDLQQAARLGGIAAHAARDAAILTVAASTARAYLTLRAFDAQLQVVRDTLRARETALRLARRRAEAGYTSELELEQARAEYEATAQAVPQAELAVSQQENALLLLTGDTQATAIPRGEPLSALRIPALAPGLPAELLRRRPDLAQAEYQLAASDANLSAARKAFLPQIDLTASTGLLFTSAVSGPIQLWSIGGSILAPIFAGGRIEASADLAAAQRDQAAFAYRRTALAAFREVNDNLAALSRLDAQAQRLRAQRDALAAALRHATNRYRAGYSPYLEQLDAQRGLLNAELSLIQVEADRFGASVALYQALGGGWDAALLRQ